MTVLKVGISSKYIQPINIDHNNIKCILQYLFWETKRKKCIPCPCDLCGKNNGIIMGHIISRDNGGTYNLENLLWTCQTCEDKIGPNNLQLKDVKNHYLLKNLLLSFLNYLQVLQTGQRPH